MCTPFLDSQLNGGEKLVLNVFKSSILEHMCCNNYLRVFNVTPFSWLLFFFEDDDSIQFFLLLIFKDSDFIELFFFGSCYDRLITN